MKELRVKAILKNHSNTFIENVFRSQVFITYYISFSEKGIRRCKGNVCIIYFFKRLREIPQIVHRK